MLLAICIIALVFGLFMRQIDVLMARAEKAHISVTLANLQTQLDLAAFHAMASGNWQQLAQLERGNPFNLMRGGANEQPGTDPLQTGGGWLSEQRYLGELDADNPVKLEVGKWYFDKVDRNIVYNIENDGYLIEKRGKNARIRYVVRLHYEDNNKNGKFDAGVDKFNKIGLVAREQVQWRF